MAITSGTYNVGPGEALEDWADVVSEINGQTFTGHVTFIQTGQITGAVGTLTPIMGAFDLTFRSALPHNGSPISGYRSINSSAFVFTGGSASGGGKVIFQDFYFDHRTGAPAGCVVVGRSGTFQIINCLARSDGSSGPARVVTNQHSGGIVEMFNVKAWSPTGTMCSIVISSGGISALRLENVTVYAQNSFGGISLFEVSNAGAASANKYIKNCIAYRVAGSAADFDLGNVACSYNASSDSSAVGTGCITGISSSHFLSTNELSANFLNLATGSSLGAAGTATSLSGNTVGIRGNLRPGVDGYYSMGADEISPLDGVNIGSGTYRVRQWPTPIVRPAIQWVQDSSGNWNGSDRGAAQDVYESEVVFFDTQDNIDTLMVNLEDNREGVDLANFAAPFFSPEVDHTGTISATVVSMGPRRQLAWGAASRWIYELPVTFRAISPTLLGTSASLSTLKLQEGFEASASHEVGKAFTYAQTAVYSDRRSDVGRFVGRFRQQTSQAQAILAYLLTTARANTVAFPSLGGVTYPWGVNRGAPANCKVKSFSIRRVNLVFWDIEIEFVESV